MSSDPFGIYVPGRQASAIDILPVSLPRIRPKQEYKEYHHSHIAANTQFRLVELLAPRKEAKAGESDEFIKCRIQIYELAEAPEYEALSYTWGNMLPNLPVTVVEEDGESWMCTTPQLMMALKRLRLVTSSRLLWIDQLAINQSDDAEKSLQVQLMGDIYRRAKSVVIWLGELVPVYPGSGYEEPAELLSEMIETVKSQAGAEISIGGPLHGLIDISEMCFHDFNPEQRRRHLMYDLLNRQWFQRAWVFQEAVLGKSLMVQLGTFQCTFPELKSLADAVHAAEQAVGRDQGIVTDTGGAEMMQVVEHARKSLSDCGECKNQESRFLPTLLKVLQRVNAFDSRDLIYAFLAFNDLGPDHAIESNYGSSVHAVWRTAATTIIEGTRSLDIFAAVPRESSTSPELPSWVPDWSDCASHSRPIAAPGSSNFNTCRRLPHVFQGHQNPNHFVVQGKIIDSIAIVGDIWRGLSPVPREGIQQAIRGHLTFRKDMPEGQINARFHTIETDIMRTITIDGANGPEQPLQRVYNLLDASKNEQNVLQFRQSTPLKDWTDEDHTLSRHYEKLKHLLKNAEGKNWFLSEQLYLGVVSPNARVGDSIAILHGSKVPCVLREADDGYHRIIGQCYLDGWMYDEPPKGSPYARWWELEQDTFILL